MKKVFHSQKLSNYYMKNHIKITFQKQISIGVKNKEKNKQKEVVGGIISLL